VHSLLGKGIHQGFAGSVVLLIVSLSCSARGEVTTHVPDDRPPFTPFWPSSDGLVGGGGELNLCVQTPTSHTGFRTVVQNEERVRRNIVGSSANGDLYLDLELYWPWRERTVLRIKAPVARSGQATTGGTNDAEWVSVIRKTDVIVLFETAGEELKARFPRTHAVTEQRFAGGTYDPYWAGKLGLTNRTDGRIPPWKPVPRAMKTTVNSDFRTCSQAVLFDVPGSDAGRRLSCTVWLGDVRKGFPAPYYAVWANGHRAVLMPEGYFSIRGVPVVQYNGQVFVEVTAARPEHADPKDPPTINSNTPFGGVALLNNPLDLPRSRPAELQLARDAASNIVVALEPVVRLPAASNTVAHLKSVRAKTTAAMQTAAALKLRTSSLTGPEKEQVGTLESALRHADRELAKLAEDAQYRADRPWFRSPPYSSRQLLMIPRVLESDLAAIRNTERVLSPPVGLAFANHPYRPAGTIDFTNTTGDPVLYLNLPELVGDEVFYEVWMKQGRSEDGFALVPRCILSGRLNAEEEPPSFWVQGIHSIEFEVFTSPPIQPPRQ